MIYLILSGRAGNQLFMYATAEAIRQEMGGDEEIVINEHDVLAVKWINSLKDYDLPHVKYIDEDYSKKAHKISMQGILLRCYLDFFISMDYQKKYSIEKKYQKLFNRFGLLLCQNGYVSHQKFKVKQNVIMLGYFQSAKYFPELELFLRKELDLEERLISDEYPHMNKLKERNSVCISIKVEHYEEGSIYDVCRKEYWINAIKYITEHVENPLFFICSDNVEYVLTHYIDKDKYDAICQPKDYPPTYALCAMSKCKHFIIGNTTFGWWAQYLASNECKIVVAPSKWMAVDMPIDIYQENWVRIGVE